MTRYCLGKDECATLSDEYDGYAVGFAYGLRLMQLCIVSASDAFGVRPGYDDFIGWTDDLSAQIDEGFDHIQRAANVTEFDDAAAETAGDSDWDPDVKFGRVTVPELMDLMRDLAEGLASVLDDLPEASAVPDLSDEEQERLDEEVVSVAGRVREVGFEACGFLTGASVYTTGPKGSDASKLDLQNVECMFANVR